MVVVCEYNHYLVGRLHIGGNAGDEIDQRRSYFLPAPGLQSTIRIDPDLPIVQSRPRQGEQFKHLVCIRNAWAMNVPDAWANLGRVRRAMDREGVRLRVVSIEIASASMALIDGMMSLNSE